MSTLSAKERDLIMRLDDLRVRFSGDDPYKALGLERGCGVDEIEDTYAKLARQLHPDRVARFDNRQITNMADSVFVLLQQCYRRAMSLESSGVSPAVTEQRPNNGFERARSRASGNTSRVRVKIPTNPRLAANLKGEDDDAPSRRKKQTDPTQVARMVKAIQRQHKRRNEDHYSYLGVSEDADLASIRKAWRQLRGQYHPDKFHGMDLGDAKKLLDSVLQRINEAGHVLAHNDRRAEYDLERKGGDEDGDDDKLDPASMSQAELQAVESDYRLAQRMMGRGDFGPAVERLRAAIKVHPDDPEVRAHFLFAQFMAEPTGSMGQRSAAARKHHEELLQMARKHRDVGAVAFFLGRTLDLMDEHSKALKMFKRAARLDPGNHEATSWKRRLESKTSVKRPTTWGKMKGIFSKK